MGGKARGEDDARGALKGGAKAVLARWAKARKRKPKSADEGRKRLK